jgi:hypothetical protein
MHPYMKVVFARSASDDANSLADKKNEGGHIGPPLRITHVFFGMRAYSIRHYLLYC